MGLDNIVVDIRRLANHLHFLTSVLEYHGLRGRVHDITLNFAELARHIEPELSVLAVVEILT